MLPEERRGITIRMAPEELKELKQLCLNRDTSIQELVMGLISEELEKTKE